MGTSGPTQYEAFMQLKGDGDYFEITKKLPLRNTYMKTADDAFVNHELDRIKKERIKKKGFIDLKHQIEDEKELVR